MALLSHRHRHRRAACALLGLLLTVSACGDALIDAAYRGEPLFSFEGQVVTFQNLQPQGHEFRVGIFWSPSGDTRAPLSQLIEQPAASVEVAFPATFTFNVFQPPEAAMLATLEGGARVGVGVILVYEDRDDNGRLSVDLQPSELLGGASQRALFYAPSALTAAASPIGEALEAGFHLVTIPLLCDAQGEPTGRGCDTPLGAACAGDADCGAEGICLTEVGPDLFPGGYCALPSALEPCDPDAVELLWELREGPVSYWLQPCGADADCRASEGYTCEPELSACWPPLPGATPPASAVPRAPDCGVPLGAACISDDDCGPRGECLLRLGGATFVGGYCAAPISEEIPCVPRGGRKVAFDDLDKPPTRWFLACGRDEDCRQGEGYYCDLFFGACTPDYPIDLELFEGFKVEPLCVEAGPTP